MAPTTDRLIFIKINKLYRPMMNDAELYEATRQSWRCSPSRNPAYALALYSGIVREVYTIDAWEKVPMGPDEKYQRWAFRGAVATGAAAARYSWHRVPEWVRKAQNPISYMNC